MLKYILLATTMTIAAPAMAQEVKTENPPASQPAPDTPTPVQDESATPPAAEPAVPVEAQTAQTPPAAETPATPAEGQPAQTAQTPPAPTEQPAAAAAATPAPAQQPAATSTQVAEVVTKEFPVYDKDANGALDQTEFGAWMSALRKASEPSFQAESAEAATWIGQAFAQADADKSKSVNQGELTTFLTPKAS